MRAFSRTIWALAFLAALAPARATIDQDYLQIYLKLNDAERLEKTGDFKNALAGFEDCFDRFEAIHNAHPDWQKALVLGRLSDCRAKIEELDSKVYLRPAPSKYGADAVLAWNLSHPAATNAAGAPSTPPFVFPSAFEPSRRHTTSYPWKTSIVTTVFWIGKDSPASGWDPHWIKDNGGADDQYDLSGYASSSHASTLNPFYVALPFNDLAHPDLATKWLPDAWLKDSKDNAHTSICKDRWIEIKNRSGRVCFAQWEDVGPITTDDAPYVFGPNRPAATRGLNVSPAVAKYLGIDSTAVTSWRFVDDEDVMPGMWLRYDEQALLFRAMHEPAETDKPAKTPAPASR